MKQGTLRDDRKAMNAVLHEGAAIVCRDSRAGCQALAAIEHLYQVLQSLASNDLTADNDTVLHSVRHPSTIDPDRVRLLLHTVYGACNDSLRSRGFIRHHWTVRLELSLMPHEGVSLSRQNAGDLIMQNDCRGVARRGFLLLGPSSQSRIPSSLCKTATGSRSDGRRDRGRVLAPRNPQ